MRAVEFARAPAGSHWSAAAPLRPRGMPICARSGVPLVHLTAWHGCLLFMGVALVAFRAEAAAVAEDPSVFVTLLKWTPLLFEGFKLNLLMSVLAMAIGTAGGVVLGLAQISLLPRVRTGSWFLTQLLRNSPWLVTLFYVMYMIPFEFSVFGYVIVLPDWVKATFGLSLPVLANVSEIVRGGVQSIPDTQWEAAKSLAFSRRQTMWMIILPQCVKRMLPPWMNLYSILTMGTVLANIVGVSEILTLTRDILASEPQTEMLLPMYAYVLVFFFVYIYPISRVTVSLERRWAVKG